LPSGDDESYRLNLMELPADLSMADTRVESKSVWDRIYGDHAQFYSKESLLGLGLVFATGAVFANTSLDSQIHSDFQSSVRGATSDHWFEFLQSAKEIGNGKVTLPIYGAAWLANEYIDGPPEFEAIGTLGERSVRGFIVGAPPLLLMQYVTGASRPGESPDGSEWHPFKDSNGVSGHAFMSSLPFITAAKMTDDPLKKTLWYAGSTLGPLSRLNDSAHYPSQIGLGWAIAYVAASSVNQTDTGKRGWSVVPQSSPTGSGIAMQYRW
jgi:hypothetical protein